MIVIWSPEASDDLIRLNDFLAIVAPNAAIKAVVSLSRAPDRLINFPRIGTRLAGFNPREVRRLIIGSYEMRYEVQEDVIYIVRIFHTLEDRPFGDA